jgi:probable F420-dependent oxidoreductase
MNSAVEDCPGRPATKPAYHREVATDFRFGVGLRVAKSLSSVQEAARRAEDLGFDLLHLPDHIGAPAPFPTLMAAAAATNRLRVGTFVLNACLYKPALLARDVQALRDLSDGRFELGLGAGYAQGEFEAAELAYPSARQRIEYLAHVTEYVREHLPDVPILIAGNGDRLLTVAAQRASIIGLTGGQPITDTADPLAERIDFVRRAAGGRFDDLELNIAITALPRDGSGQPDLSITRGALPQMSDEELLRTPAVLSGSTLEIVDTIRSYRDTYGVSYLIVQDKHAEAFSKVIAELR